MGNKEENKPIHNELPSYNNMYIKNIQIKIRSADNNALITAEGPPGTYVYFYLSRIETDTPIRGYGLLEVLLSCLCANTPLTLITTNYIDPAGIRFIEDIKFWQPKR